MTVIVTLQEIAKAAGVNVSTVSRAVNNQIGIGEETRSQILKIAAQMGYRGKKDILKRKSIGIVVPELASHYYAALTHTLERHIREKGYCTFIAVTDYQEEKMLEVFETMRKGEVVGIIFFRYISLRSSVTNDIFSAAEAVGIPVLFLSDGEAKDNEKFDQVNLNQRSGIEQLLTHLLSLGHTRIGFLGEQHSVSRLHCLQQLMEQEGLELSASHVKIGTTRFERGGYEQMKRLLKEPELPTAVFACYDQFAIGALKAVWEEGLRVPEDISLVGFDNIEMCEFLPRKLTTVTNPVESMGEIAAKLLFARIRDEGVVVQSVSLYPVLVVQETTKALQSSV